MRWVWKVFENFIFNFLNSQTKLSALLKLTKINFCWHFLNLFKVFRSFLTFFWTFNESRGENSFRRDFSVWAIENSIQYWRKKICTITKMSLSKKRSSTLARWKFSMNRKIIYEKNSKIFSLKIPRQFYLCKLSFNTSPNFSQFLRRSQLKTKFFLLIPTHRKSWTRFYIKNCYFFQLVKIQYGGEKERKVSFEFMSFFLLHTML